ncbi:tRNA (N6-isopentenyl adenosine(37)-C2)-methylthiotransferase MiaB [Candidatus Omnitrophota bacterium]
MKPHAEACGQSATKCPRVYIRTFGCQMNDRDSEALAGLLRDAGFALVDSSKKADVVLLNTCSVRDLAEEKAWSEAGKLKKVRSQQSTVHGPSTVDRRPIIGIIGCMAQNYKDEIFKRAPHVDLVAGPNDLLSIPLLVKEVIKEKSQALAVSTMEREQDVYASDYRESAEQAHIVISEGCSNFCSYCVVPYVRGRLHNRHPEDILEEIKRVVDKGITTITLLGQNVNSYRKAEVDFVSLLEMVNAIDGLTEISFVTSHPKDTSERLFIAMRDLKRVKKTLHLPIQSGSDRILDKMNRGYSAKEYLRLIQQYRSIVNGEVGTDFIVGFPSETEEDFQDTCTIAKEVEFDFAYIFKYSPRPHTKAADFPDDVKAEKA